MLNIYLLYIYNIILITHCHYNIYIIFMTVNANIRINSYKTYSHFINWIIDLTIKSKNTYCTLHFPKMIQLSYNQHSPQVYCETQPTEDLLIWHLYPVPVPVMHSSNSVVWNVSDITLQFRVHDTTTNEQCFYLQKQWTITRLTLLPW